MHEAVDEVDSLIEQEQDLGTFATPEIKLPPKPSEAHQGAITSITHLTTKNGAHAIAIGLASTNNGRLDEITVWVPQAVVDNVQIDQSELEKLPAREGKTQTPLVQWGMAKRTVLRLVEMAREQGREVPRDRATDFDDYVAKLDQLCNNLEVVYTIACDKGNEQFQHILRGKSLYEPDLIAKKPKLFENYLRRWEAQDEQ